MQKIWNSLMFVKVIIQAKLEDLISKSVNFNVYTLNNKKLY